MYKPKEIAFRIARVTVAALGVPVGAARVSVLALLAAALAHLWLLFERDPADRVVERLVAPPRRLDEDAQIVDVLPLTDVFVEARRPEQAIEAVVVRRRDRGDEAICHGPALCAAR